MLKYLFSQLEDRDFSLVYLVLFGLMFAVLFLKTTMVTVLFAPHSMSALLGHYTPVIFDVVFTDCARLVCAAMLVYAVLFVRYHWWQAILAAAVLLLGVMVYVNSGVEDVLFTSIAIVCAKDTMFRKIAWIYLIEGVALSVLAFVLASAGVTQMLIYAAPEGTRWAFGSVYPTDFCAHIFFLSCSWFYLRYSKLNLLDTAAFMVLAVFCQTMCRARNSAICLGVLTVLALIVFLRRTVLSKYAFKGVCHICFIVCLAVPPILAVTMFALSYYFDPSNPLLSQLDSLFSTRLQLAHKGFVDYDVQPFGQAITMVGNGGSVVFPTNYFFLDSSYINILLRLGWVMFLAVLVVYELVICKAWKKGIPVIALVITLAFLHSFMEHHFIEIIYNVFLLTVSTKWSLEKEKIPSQSQSYLKTPTDKLFRPQEEPDARRTNAVICRETNGRKDEYSDVVRRNMRNK